MSNNKKERIVVKLGTSTLTNGGTRLDRAHMLEIVRAVNALVKKGFQIVLVSSGAIAAGREFLNYPDLPSEVCYKQMLASVGQGRLIELWQDLFSIYGLKIGQLLLTRADLENRERYLNARETLKALLELSVIPIINENDAVSIAEIKVGDNDNLAALSAVLAEADKVILLTDQKGLYTADPRLDPKAKLIKEVLNIDQNIIALAGGSGTKLGTGGMATKIQAAKIAIGAGIELVIASGREPQELSLLAEGKGEGTYFKPSLKPVLARKSWIATATRPKGTVIVDEGAVKALKAQGSSLLPKGIVAVTGEFLRGETILIVTKEGYDIARGLTRYSSDELKKIIGHNSDEIEGILGFTHGSEAVHRDDLVLLG